MEHDTKTWESQMMLFLPLMHLVITLRTDEIGKLGNYR